MPDTDPFEDDIDRVVCQFEDEWKAGRRPDVEVYVAAGAGLPPGQLRRELVLTDIQYRRKGGEGTAGAADYPALSPADRGWVEGKAGPPPPTAIGRYVVLDRLAQGGQAMTYRAYHPGLRREVVLKVADAPAAAGADPLLAQEGRILAELRHPNLVPVFDLELHDGRVVLALEPVAGRTAAEWAAAERPDPRRAAAVVAGAARGLGAAHRHGVSHLDVTPRNVLVQADGTPRVIDFGLARHAGWLAPPAAGGSGGTPAYLSPEQANLRGDRLGPRTDVFGLGGLLYFLLTGQPLYPGGFSDALTAARTAAFDPAPLAAAGVPPRLRAVCRKALALDPDDRYPNGDAVAAALATALRPRWRQPLRAGLAGAGLFAVAVVAGWLIGRPRPVPLPPLELGVEVEVQRAEVLRPLADALPVRAGEKLRVRVRVPKETAVGLYSVNATQLVVPLAHYPAGEEREEFFPPQSKLSVLGGPAGNDLLLAVGRAGGPVDDAEVARLWAGSPAWVPLPDDVAMRVRGDRVEWATGRPRDVTEVVADDSPAEQVRQRLDGFRGRLRAAGLGRCDGVAFGHR